MEKQLIKISGGGIASLACAINLRLAGFDVLIYERNQDVGQHRYNDWQGLENWTTNEDVLEFLKRINIKINFSNHPWFEAVGLDADLGQHRIKSNNPLFYLVRRGSVPDSLDQGLKKQVQDLGVRFEFNKAVQSQEVDIVGTGHAKNSYGMVFGVIFETNLPNMVMYLLDNNIAPQGYAYLIVVNNQATLAICFTTSKKHLKVGRQCLEKAIEQFQRINKFSIENPKHFSGSASLGFLKNKDKIYIGEAGGFQDGFLGFGMKHAFLSGYLAAQSIIKADSYQKAAQTYWQTIEKEIYPLTKTSVVNRFLYEFFTNKIYKRLLERISKTSDFHRSVRKQYQPKFYKNLLFPIAKLKAKKNLIH